jgi:hypothetical protein
MVQPLCEEIPANAPRVGCGCRRCYRARETSLDPRLLALATYQSPIVLGLSHSPSRDLLLRGLREYLAGRLDFGALHLTLITGLMELGDNQFKRLMNVAARTAPVLYVENPGAPVIGKPSRDVFEFEKPGDPDTW